MHTNTRSILYTGAAAKAIPLNALPEEAWTPLGGQAATAESQTFANAVAYLYRAIEVRANALCAVPWRITRGDSDEPLWASEDEDPPTELTFAVDLPNLLWRTAVAWAFYSQAFWLKERNRVRVLGLKWLDPASVTPVWDERAGLTHFERQLSAKRIPLSLDETVYLWRQSLSETAPATPPAQAAMQAAGVLYNADAFAAAFFERGAIKATLLTIDGNPPPEDIKKLEGWAKRFLSGVKNAWSMPGIRADVKAVQVGEGLESLTNATLTAEKREDIATALGVPHSLIMANAANYATAQQDERNFYNLTITPDCLLLQRQLNRQLFGPLGLRFVFMPQEMAVYQEDESKRSQSFATYVNAGLPVPLVAEMLGLYLPAGMQYSDLVTPEPEPEPMPPQADDSPDSPDDNADNRQEEVKRLKRWLKKRGNADPDGFKSSILDSWEKAAIAAQLKAEAQPGATGSPFRPDTWEAYP